jgi:hypothetical protein
MKNAPLARFGPTPYALSAHLPSGPIVVAVPVANAVDWRNAWSRGYVGAAQADPEAATR